MTPIMHKAAVVLLLVVGVQLWLLIGRGQYGSAPRPAIFFGVIAVASLPPFFRRATRGLDRIRQVTPRTRMLIALAIFVIATPLLYWTAVYQHRELFPKMHDEYMHLLQLQMLARGKLWMAPHEAADSFESFHIFVKPVYASIYFPGASLMHVPAVWLSLPYAAIPCAIAGACVAMMYRVIAELLDNAWGILAALMLVSLEQFRYVSTIVVSHPAMLLLGLAMIWAWLRWRRSPTIAWAAAIGAVSGWAAITRPVDAICYAAPVALAMIYLMFRQRWPWRRMFTTLAIIIVAAAPFLALQIVFNLGVTGRWNETPYHRYAELFTPGMSFGFHHPDPNTHPQTTLPQRLAYYEDYTLTATRTHRPELLWHTWTRERFPLLATRTLPSELLLILIPPALLGVRRRDIAGGGVLLSTLVLFVALYAFFAYLLLHYVVPFTPAIIFAVLLGAHVTADTFPRARPWLVTVLTTIIVMLCLRALPQFNRLVADDTLNFPTLRFDQRLPSMVETPALVLYHFNASDDPDEEPVYNIDVAWPDDARIIRVQDRSPEMNQRLLRYYAQRQPERRVYRIDRARVTDPAYRPEYLGRVDDLAGPR